MWAMQIAYQMAEVEPGAIYSIEMKGTQVARRAVSGVSKIPTRALKTGSIDDVQWDKFIHTVGKLDLLPVYMSDGEGWTTSSLRADLARMKARHNIKWFVLDYMSLLSDSPHLSETDRSIVVSRGLKNACKGLDLAGVIVQSMTKEGMKSEGAPNQAHMKGSAQVAFDADLICYLTNFVDVKGDMFLDKDEEAALRTLWFAKGRELENPKRYMHFMKHTTHPAFSEVEE
jgi:replicative DNA helicase